MIATDASCLSAERLRDLASGRLPSERFARLLDHLDSCPECQQRAETLGGTDDSLAALAVPAAVDPHMAEPDCIAVMRACSQHRTGPNRPGVHESSLPPIEQLGQYQLIRPLGSGAMGAVYLAQHTRLRRQCAIKLLPQARGFDAAWRDRFDREMAAVAALSHPHVVSASDAGEAAGWHYFVMEYLDGLDLSRLAARIDRISINASCELVRQAAVGLAHIHAAGLVHRDIKPSNLMLTRDGVVKILDLGLVLSGTDPLPSDDRLTTIGQLMGTLAYMAPEQLVDSAPVDSRADLYALGATLYRLLAGTAPHSPGRGIAQMVIAKTASAAPAITSHRSDLPADLVELIEMLLDRDPAERPQSAGEVAERLQRHCEGASPRRLIASALRQPPGEGEAAVSSPQSFTAAVASAPASPPRRPWKRLLIAAAALPLLLLAGIAMVISTDRGDLVIQSDAEGLNVSVQQGEELVEELQLTTGENRVTLRSGTYTVTLDTAADGLQLSGNTAKVMRGGEAVLQVRRDRAAPATLTDDAFKPGPFYQGQPLEHWLAVLESERDVKTVIDAMYAVVELTKDAAPAEEATATEPSDRMRAAQAMLQAARRYGGMIATGGDSGPPSGRFMTHLPPLYMALMPEPGLDAISNELAVGTPQSSMAALLILYNYTSETHGEYEYAQPEFGGLDRWGKTPLGRVKLNQLARNIDAAVERLGGYEPEVPTIRAAVSYDQTHRGMAINAAYQARLRISLILGADVMEDPVISGPLLRRIAEAAAFYQGLQGQAERAVDTADLTRLSNVELEAAINQHDEVAFAWAAVPSLLQIYSSDPS